MNVVWLSDDREMQKLQNEKLPPKINQFLSAEGLRDGFELVPGSQTSLCSRAEPLWPRSIFRGVCSCLGGSTGSYLAQIGVVVAGKSSVGERDGLTACLSSNRTGRDDSIIISRMK